MGEARTPSQGRAEQTLQEVLAMGRGDGEGSYSKNSGLQAAMNQLSWPALNEALERVSLPSEGGSPVSVVDLGSSSGPNTIANVGHIIDQLRHRLAKKDEEFQAYFNDLPSNDFNNLFRLLSNDSRARKFYAAGVPGSFFDRLFALSSVNVFFSSISVQFLSKVPDAVLDKSSSAYNRGRTWVVNPGSSTVAKLYQKQAAEDLERFLQARAAELVSGGLLFACFLGRSPGEPNEPSNSSVYDLQVYSDEAWSSLIKDGLVTEHDHDSFNFPIYVRSIEELREGVGKCSTLFDELTVESKPIDVNFAELYGTSEPTAISRKISELYEAVFGHLLESQVGKETSAVFWKRLAKAYEKRIRTSTPDPRFLGQLCIVSLIRK